jgi:SAM-dependent methyltransferase
VKARIATPGRALDVGCATGTFLAGLQRAGWQVQGVEINQGVAEYARRQAGLDVFAGDLLEAGYPAGSFDLVSFWDVLEHLPNPREILREAYRITRSSGMLLLSLPNPSSLEAWQFGRAWAGWDVPRHLWLSPPSAVSRLLEETGWELIDLTCQWGRQWLFVLSLRGWLADRGVPARLSAAITTVTGSLPAKIVLWPYFTMLEWTRRSSIAVFYARKARGG